MTIRHGPVGGGEGAGDDDVNDVLIEHLQQRGLAAGDLAHQDDAVTPKGSRDEHEGRGEAGADAQRVAGDQRAGEADADADPARGRDLFAEQRDGEQRGHQRGAEIQREQLGEGQAARGRVIAEPGGQGDAAAKGERALQRRFEGAGEQLAASHGDAAEHDGDAAAEQDLPDRNGCDQPFVAGVVQREQAVGEHAQPDAGHDPVGW